MGLNLVPRVLSYPSLRNERETLVASGHVACVQTSPISFVARGEGTFSRATKEIGDVCTQATGHVAPEQI